MMAKDGGGQRGAGEALSAEGGDVEMQGLLGGKGDGAKTPGGVVWRTGWLRKQAQSFGHEWSRRYFVLTSNELAYYKQPKVRPRDVRSRCARTARRAAASA